MIDRLPELNRVLQTLATLGGAGPAQRIRLESIIEHCRSQVFGGRMPDHALTLQFASDMGLVILTDDYAELAVDGHTFLSLNQDTTYELTGDQSRLLARRHYFDGYHSQACRRLFTTFSISYETNRYEWSNAEGNELPVGQWLIEHLIQLGVLERANDLVFSTPMYGAVIADFVEQPKGMTEEKLKQILKDKEEVGEIAENLVFEYEKRRLQQAECRVESHCVRRVSKLRVNAGYDVESFDAQSISMIFDRFIEVKGARQKDLRFFWSENEMNVAKRLGDKYWIYFQGGIDPVARTSSVEPLFFQNPLRSLLESPDVTRTTQGVLVQGKLRGEQV